MTQSMQESYGEMLGRLPASSSSSMEGSYPTCAICGRHPAIRLHLRRSVGMLFTRRWISFDGALCREHGVRLGAAWLGKTLIVGWWGTISFFANFVAIVMDLFAIARAILASRPIGREEGLSSRALEPSSYKWPNFWVPGILAYLAIGLLAEFLTNGWTRWDAGGVALIILGGPLMFCVAIPVVGFLCGLLGAEPYEMTRGFGLGWRLGMRLVGRRGKWYCV